MNKTQHIEKWVFCYVVLKLKIFTHFSHPILYSLYIFFLLILFEREREREKSKFKIIRV